LLQKDNNNQAEAERLWQQAARKGSANAQAALDAIVADRARQTEEINRTNAQLTYEREQRARNLAQVKITGQTVCTSFSGSSAGRFRTFKVRAFTEGSNGNKIQVRIGGIQKFDGSGNNLGNTDRVDGDTVYQNGGVIWDEASNWNPC
jgi:hypothetical protein